MNYWCIDGVRNKISIVHVMLCLQTLLCHFQLIIFRVSINLIVSALTTYGLTKKYCNYVTFNVNSGSCEVTKNTAATVSVLRQNVFT